MRNRTEGASQHAAALISHLERARDRQPKHAGPRPPPLGAPALGEAPGRGGIGEAWGSDIDSKWCRIHTNTIKFIMLLLYDLKIT
jgi:hypothetical protein